MTRGELSLGLCVLHKGKGLEVVGALGKLVVAVHVAIVHQAPTTLNKREHASALHSILGNLAIARVQGPCVRLVQVGKGVLPDALMTSSLGFEKEVEHALLILNDIGVDGRLLIVEKNLWLALQIGEIGVGIAVIHSVIRNGAIIGEQ